MWKKIHQIRATQLLHLVCDEASMGGSEKYIEAGLVEARASAWLGSGACPGSLTGEERATSGTGLDRSDSEADGTSYAKIMTGDKEFSSSKTHGIRSPGKLRSALRNRGRDQCHGQVYGSHIVRKELRGQK